MVVNEPNVVSRIMGLPWVQDGLDQTEMAFLVVLLREGTYGDYALFEDLLESHYSQSKTVSLPLAGDVNIWVFQSVPFSSGEDIPAVIEDTVRTIEGFMGERFPATEIVVLIDVLQPDQPPSIGGIHHGSHIKINRAHGEQLEHMMSTLIHELAHYYRFSPPWWLNESFAHLTEGYVALELGTQNMAQVRAEVSDRVQRNCSREDIATISQAVFLDQFSFVNPGRCTRALGLTFLHQALDLMGGQRMATALGELDSFTGALIEATEEAVFHALLSNAPPERQEEFRDLYRQLHGGPYVDPELDRSDDHGDSLETATEVAAGHVVEGVLNYRTDVDYFRLDAQGNQKYRFEVDHETLRAADVMVLAGPRERSPVKDKVRVSSGPLVQWIAPATDSYYFAVLNWIGASGEYTLRIIHVPDLPDDHGDSTATATDVSTGDTVQGLSMIYSTWITSVCPESEPRTLK